MVVKCNLFESKRSKEEINWAIKRYEVKPVQYSEGIELGHKICGEYANVVGFMTYVYDKPVSEVMKLVEGE